MAKRPQEVPETGTPNSRLFVAIDGVMYIATYDKSGNFEIIHRLDQTKVAELANQTTTATDDYGHEVTFVYDGDGKLASFQENASIASEEQLQAPEVDDPSVFAGNEGGSGTRGATPEELEVANDLVREREARTVTEEGSNMSAVYTGVRTVVRMIGGKPFYVTLSPTGQVLSQRPVPGGSAEAFAVPEQRPGPTSWIGAGGVPAAQSGNTGAGAGASTAVVPSADVVQDAIGAGASGTGGAAQTGVPGTGGASRGSNAFSRSIIGDQLQNAFDNPQALIRAYANYRDFDEHGGKEASLQRLAPSLGILWMIANEMQGKTSLDQAGIQGSRNYVDFIDPFMKSILGHGGSMLDSPGKILNALIRPRGATLQSYLGTEGGEGAAALTRTDQVDNMLQAARYGLSSSLPTPVLNALLNVMSVTGRDYAAEELTGDTTGSFADRLRVAIR